MELRLSPKGYLNSDYQAKQNSKVNSGRPFCRQDINFGDSFSMIKPEVIQYEKFILKKIKDADFKVVKKEKCVLSEEITKAHYAGLHQAALKKLESGKDFLMKIYDNVIENMQKGPVKKLIIEGDEAEVQRFKKFVGATRYEERDPKSLRAMIEAKEVKRLRKTGATEDEIRKFREEFTFVHASDTDYFDPEHTIKNYDREIDLHFPGYRK